MLCEIVETESLGDECPEALRAEGLSPVSNLFGSGAFLEKIRKLDFLIFLYTVGS